MKDNRESLRPYVADMAAVEKHILEAVERQREDDGIKEFPEAAQLVGRLESILRNHVQELESHAESFGGGGAASTVKEAVTGALGFVAGLYDKVRKDKASRALRDDYTALSLASVSYTMLHTTALGLSQGTTADIALNNLREINQILIEISQAIPRVVLKELSFEGYPVETGLAERAVQNTQEAWSRSSLGQTVGVGASSVQGNLGTGGSFTR